MKEFSLRLKWLAYAALVAFTTLAADTDGSRRAWSGIYPHLAFFNDENECGTGAVAPWAGHLWVVTYAPHKPTGSTDKLYRISRDLELHVFPGSIGGTPANRMIHRESGQLFIGPYAVGDNGEVRVIPYETMYGRPTGNARHLTDPIHRIYAATMEEGFYEMDVRTLEVTELFRDEQLSGGRKAGLPGYHGKGLYSGQGRLVYANNGEHGAEAQRRPDVPSGVLAEWDGSSSEWRVVRRNQFTEVTGPGGIEGNPRPDIDPIWSIGWDHRSLILMVLDHGKWSSYRLPKASHAYDGAHGWNTEWPRIRDVGESNWLMTMHGMFWSFPKGFNASHSAGILPRSTYLKVIGDFCRWEDRIVFGCDDTARNEFLNKRKAKGNIAAPQSQSNLWFLDPGQIDQIGPVIGRGAVWLEEPVEAGAPSDPYLYSGFDRRGLHLYQEGASSARILLEYDALGNGAWKPWREIELPEKTYQWLDINDAPEHPEWVRLTSDKDLRGAVAMFHFSNREKRAAQPDDVVFKGIAKPKDRNRTGGVMRARSDNLRTLHYAAMENGPEGPRDLGYYELGADMKLRAVQDPRTHAWLKEHAAIPADAVTHDDASVIFVNDDGARYRLPWGEKDLTQDGLLGPHRVDREVSTERDLFNAYGTFYELPAENAGGFLKIRPVATHNRRIIDYCSYRGLLVISGLDQDPSKHGDHVLSSDDGKTALWVGAVDDLWKFGKPTGSGGPWKDRLVQAGEVSDPFLMTGFDAKNLKLETSEQTRFTIEIDIAGTGLWMVYDEIVVESGQTWTHDFPEAFQAYWIRFRSSRGGRVTAFLHYH